MRVSTYQPNLDVRFGLANRQQFDARHWICLGLAPKFRPTHVGRALFLTHVYKEVVKGGRGFYASDASASNETPHVFNARPPDAVPGDRTVRLLGLKGPQTGTPTSAGSRDARLERHERAEGGRDVAQAGIATDAANCV
jgi:hypothetical protein